MELVPSLGVRRCQSFQSNQGGCIIVRGAACFNATRYVELAGDDRSSLMIVQGCGLPGLERFCLGMTGEGVLGKWQPVTSTVLL
jgi:hypothetical protein